MTGYTVLKEKLCIQSGFSCAIRSAVVLVTYVTLEFPDLIYFNKLIGDCLA
jgi:hypothetical protein